MQRVSKYITLKKRLILTKSCFISQFSYCPLIWMAHSRGVNHKINHIHERTLWIVFKDFSTSCEGFLAKDKSVTIHNRNLQQLVIEIFKVKMGISPIITNESFSFSGNNKYNLRKGIHLSRPIFHMTHYRTESITNLGAKIWQLVPQNIKEANPLSSFKSKVEKWNTKKLPGRLCETYSPSWICLISC